MIARLRHWWLHLCGEYVRTPRGGGDDMRGWDF
jgi:hypothetical protein